MEALADRELAPMDLDSGDEALPGGTLPAQLTDVHGEPPLSQSSGSELPASQPQPLASQLDMEDDGDNVIIEEYDSDAT